MIQIVKLSNYKKVKSKKIILFIQYPLTYRAKDVF